MCIRDSAVGALAMLEPQLFKFEPLGCDVETEGELTRGVLVADRRTQPDLRPNVNVATEVRAGEVRQYIIDQLTTAGHATQD